MIPWVHKIKEGSNCFDHFESPEKEKKKAPELERLLNQNFVGIKILLESKLQNCTDCRICMLMLAHPSRPDLVDS
jgi:hypothetical protein